MSTKELTPAKPRHRNFSPVNITMASDVKRMTKDLCKVRRRSRSGLITDLIVEAHSKL